MNQDEKDFAPTGVSPKTRFPISNATAWLRLRTACAARLLLLLALPAVVQAQDYIYTTNNGTITITGYTGSGRALTIPSTINGLPVTSIGDNAFWHRTSLTSVTIPNGITSLGGGAFYGCNNLNSVTIPTSVASIADYAFNACTRLTGVYFQGNAPSFGLDVFKGDNLATVYYLAGTTGWGSTFTDRPAVLWNPQVPFTYTTNNNLITITGYTGPGGEVIIPSTIDGLPVTSIWPGAFASCRSLASVTIPNSVTWIGEGLFANCNNLTSVTISDIVTSIEGATFAGCTSLTSVTIPNSVTSIGGAAFENCPSLAGIFFKGNAPSVSSWAFNVFSISTIYYLPGTTGWGPAFAGRPTAIWNPQVQTSDASFGVRPNQFGFNITWASGQVVVVEACSELANPTWSPLQTNTLTSGSLCFSDPGWTNYPARFYRLRSP